MEIDPNYEYEAPKWFDFTTNFQGEVNDNLRWEILNPLTHEASFMQANNWRTTVASYTIIVGQEIGRSLAYRGMH